MSAVHDHFDGSAHCVECGGPCKLTGAERALTEMVRWRLDTQAYAWHNRKGHEPWLSIRERETLAEIGADSDALIRRSMEAAAAP